MIIRVVIVVSVLLLQYVQTANIQTNREQHELTISECAAKGGECDETKGRPVCGTDDRTYPTRCHLLRVQCSGHQVSLKYRGACKACKEAREYALRHKAKTPPKFVPRCKTDGTYAPVQCLDDTGCWCSDRTGKPIENTSVRTGKPNCREYSKANIRRSPARHLSPSRSRRTCTQLDRVAFNSNLINIFRSEYTRSRQQVHDVAVGIDSAAADKSVLDWKFTHLDVNTNRMLDKNEFRELKKLVKRAVKPRRCGRAFGKFCDVNEDGRLSQNEWNSCLTKDGNNRHSAVGGHHSSDNNSKNNKNNNNNNNNRHPLFSNHHQVHTNNHQNTINNNHNNNNNKNIHQQTALDVLESESESTDDNNESSQHLDYEEDGDDYDTEDGYDDYGVNLSMLNTRTFGSSTNLTSFYFLRPDPKPEMKPAKESEGDSDCWADQAAVLEIQNHGGTLLYVPECTSDGRYQRVQCYRSTPYCWCVHEDSGKNIPGTSVKDKRPQCDAIGTVSRPMKGCSEPRKTIFLKELKEFLKTYILSNANTSMNTTKWNSEDERIATLSFVFLDKNKNKAWERKEWKTFRELMTNSKTLRKCGKKMPRYCDVNSDKKITLSEWLNCLQAQRIDVETTQKPTQTNETVTSKPSKLVGSNPLEQYLKD